MSKWPKNLGLGTNFGSFSPNVDPGSFFNGFYLYCKLDILASYHCMQFQGKLTNQPWENSQKNLVSDRYWPLWPKLGPWKYFSWFLPLIHVRHCCKLSLYTISRKQPWENGKEPSFGPNFDLLGQSLGHQNFVSKIWFCKSLDIMVSYDHVQYQEKLITQSWENLVTDGWMDRRTQWFHRMLSQ